ncbi:hypothetical protein N24_2407 [Corynebacterium suranareeae]|uniref:Uncharacterized protein n=1 Tax=Corynebacterium suranareeae TaxID=2506452 RepID=A0A160PRF4_9CORY|nr:hypothetical protein N24_2407 [Corynebacterium suranareeae]
MDRTPFAKFRDNIPDRLTVLDEVHTYARSRALLKTHEVYKDQTIHPQE